jgi:superfamily II DNA helicase RecQ
VRAVLDAPAETAEVAGVARTKVRSIRAMARQLKSRDADTIAREYAVRQDADRAKLESMTRYAQSAQCRWKLLLDNFGEADGFGRCGSCDNCVMPLEERLRA